MYLLSKNCSVCLHCTSEHSDLISCNQPWKKPPKYLGGTYKRWLSNGEITSTLSEQRHHEVFSGRRSCWLAAVLCIGKASAPAKRLVPCQHDIICQSRTSIDQLLVKLDLGYGLLTHTLALVWFTSKRFQELHEKHHFWDRFTNRE